LEELYEKLKLTEQNTILYENKLKLLHNNNNDHTWREIDILQEKLQKQQYNLQQEKIQSEKIYLEFTLLKEWMNVIIYNLVKYLKIYNINIDLNQQNNLNNDDPKKLVEILYKYIENMLNIINDIKTGTFSIKPKKQEKKGANSQNNNNKQKNDSTNNKQEQDMMMMGNAENNNQNNNNNLSIESNNKRNSKKKTRKSKYMK